MTALSDQINVETVELPFRGLTDISQRVQEIEARLAALDEESDEESEQGSAGEPGDKGSEEPIPGSAEEEEQETPVLNTASEREAGSENALAGKPVALASAQAEGRKEKLNGGNYSSYINRLVSLHEESARILRLMANELRQAGEGESFPEAEGRGDGKKSVDDDVEMTEQLGRHVEGV